MSQNFDPTNVGISVFQKNYNQLSDEKKEILNQKYTCAICLEIVKYENPYFCYKCQKIFHHSCLKNWDERQKQLNKRLSCPNCRNESNIEDWKVLINYEENRIKDAIILNQLEKSFNPDKYIRNSINVFKLILNKLNIIHPMIDSPNNNELKNLIEEFQSDIKNPQIEEISSVIIKELDSLEEYIMNTKKSLSKEEIKYKNEINLKYLTKREGSVNIFGSSFIDNNGNNINLIINGNKSPLVTNYYLQKGENVVTICLQNKLNNLSGMFSYCETLYDIDELKYLNTEDVTDFSFMFEYCKIANFKALKSWNTSKSETFSNMFSNCELITNLKFLKNWDVSRCKKFNKMFNYCVNLTDIKSLENWNVSNGTDFSYLFCSCNKLSDIKSLTNWNVSKCNTITYIFCNNLISDLKPLENWDVSNVTDFKGAFEYCKKISDITPLKNWNVSNGTNFALMFYNCSLEQGIKPLENWNFSKAKNFRMLFASCSFSDLTPLKNWNVSNVTDFSYMFSGCSSITDLKPLENWNVSNGNDFRYMFLDLRILTDVSPLKEWNVSNCKNFKSMFMRCNSIKNRNLLKNWKFAKDTDFSSMF